MPCHLVTFLSAALLTVSLSVIILEAGHQKLALQDSHLQIEGTYFSGGQLENQWKDSAAKLPPSTFTLSSRPSLQPSHKPLVVESISSHKSGNSSLGSSDIDGCFQSVAEIPPDPPNRHMVPPPNGPRVLVCCATTAGPLNIAVHPNWAPLGAKRFLDMVESGHFSTRVPLFRCIRNFICQFGLSGVTGKSSQGSWGSIKDDPSWLPLGPSHRENDAGVKRFAKGYLAYAGGGKNSRGVQLIMALGPNGRLCGGSPWEVPWGEVVGERSFRTLDSIYVG